MARNDKRRPARTAMFALVSGMATALGVALATGLVRWARQR
ncbi:hypothetical protein ACFRQM_35940 [Streptomyces sp. NPDC056831]